MKIAIVGYGIEGRSARRFLRKQYPRAEIEIRDVKRSPKYLEGLELFDMIVRSPGVKYLLPEIQRAKKKGARITSVTKLFFENANGAIIGMTGTKGKGTTASMLLRILKKAGKDVYLVGNIGTPMLNILPKLTKGSIVIVELSSFQLQDVDASPHIAVILDIVPDHLNYHRTMREYASAKSNICAHQSPRDKVFYIAQNALSRSAAQKGKGKKYAVDFDHFKLFTPGDLTVPGHYNFKNSIVAATVAQSFGISPQIIKKTITSFRGLQYHLSLERERDGVRYYNDSASTNPVSTEAALSVFTTPKILIMGGADKNFDYSVLRLPVKNNNVRQVILFGSNKAKIKKAIIGCAPIRYARDLPEAVHMAERMACTGDAVLFSPASASFDMFHNSKDRGRTFSKIVKSL